MDPLAQQHPTTRPDVLSESGVSPFRNSAYQKTLARSLALLAGSIVVSFYAIRYATERASSPVTDLVLSNIPVIEVDGTFAVATLLLVATIVVAVFARPWRAPFALNALALFFYIRSGFITLTHIGPYPAPPPDTNWGSLMSHFLFSGDQFFSGHVGTPFLMALLFWRQPYLRYLFLGWSVVMATIVLLGHLHYSIDVASAYFITYTIFAIAVHVFPQTYALFSSHEAKT